MVLKDEEIQKAQDQWVRETAQEERKIIRKATIGKYNPLLCKSARSR
jgi:hypothetical protein